MKKSDSQSLQKTLAFAATVAALGASVGVPVEQALAAPPTRAPQDQTSESGRLLLAFTLVEEPAKQTPGQSSAAKAGAVAVQQKADRGQGTLQGGAHQYKENKAKALGGAGGAGSNNMLNPQPLPPKQGFGINSTGPQSPAIQK